MDDVVMMRNRAEQLAREQPSGVHGSIAGAIVALAVCAGNEAEEMERETGARPGALAIGVWVRAVSALALLRTIPTAVELVGRDAYRRLSGDPVMPN